MSRQVLVVGGCPAAAKLAGSLSGRVQWVDPRPGEVDDEFVARVRAGREGDGGAESAEAAESAEEKSASAPSGVGRGVSGADGLDLVVHALYPDASLMPLALAEMTLEHWRSACDATIEAGLRLARGAHPHLLARGGTMVFCVPTLASAGAAGFTTLATAAEGMRVLARSLAKSWGSDGIRVHAVSLHPGEFLSAEHADAVVSAMSIADPALGRMPDAQELAAMVDALASRAASGVTGTTMVIDGGTWMAG